MSQLDDVDREILELLSEDARRSLRDIASEVGRSAPTVSNRIETLQDLGVIERFTVDVDRSTLVATNRTLVRADATPGTAPSLADELATCEDVEHVLRSVGGTVVATVVAESPQVDTILQSFGESFPEVEWSVEPLAGSDWNPEVGITGAFDLMCTVCGNRVSDDGERVRLGQGDHHVVCCSSCAAEITDRYERLSKEAGGQTE